MTDLADRLADALDDIVRDVVGDVAGDVGPDAVLLTCAVGRPVTLASQAGLPRPALAQLCSDFVDVLPQPGAAGFVPELDSFSLRYGALLAAATRRTGLPDDVGAGVDAALAAARRRYANAELPRLDLPQSVWLTRQDPVDWFRAEGTQWRSLRVSESDAPTTTRPGRPGAPWAWRTLTKGQSPPTRVPHPQVETMARPAPAEEAAARPVPPTVPDVRAQRDLVERTSILPVQSTGQHIELAYTVVTLQRDWLDTTWWTNPHWQVPGTDPGGWSAGDVTVPDQMLAAVPVALVAVKDVVVTAQWSGLDTRVMAAGMPAALGPFSLAGGRLESGRLEVPGVQVVAYLCKVPPPLPPPAAGPPTALTLPDLGRGDVGDAVRTLQGLLMARGRFSVSPDLLTGTFGPRTEQAVRALRPDGRVDQSVWRMLLGL